MLMAGMSILPPSITVASVPMPVAMRSCTAPGSWIANTATSSSSASRIARSTVIESIVPPEAALS